MNILLLGNFLSERLSTRSPSEELSMRLASRGWIVSSASGRLNRAARFVDILRTILGERRDYEAANVDVYSGLAFCWAEAAGALLRILDKPFVLTLHGGNLLLLAHDSPTRVRHLLASADAVVTPSEYLATSLRGLRSDIRVIPNAIETGRYPYVGRLRPVPRLIWLRAFHKIYHPEMAVRVLHCVVQSEPLACLTMIGPDKGDGSLERTRRLAADLGLEGALDIRPGVRKEMVPTELAKGDVFLNTTNVESFGVSVVEAMACGLCVVTTDAGGIPYVVSNERDGLIVPKGDVAAMASAVLRVLKEPGLAGILSQNARETALRHDWSLILPQWEELFRTVAARGMQACSPSH